MSRVIFLYIFIMLCGVLITPAAVSAVLSKDCENCHTMHNSQSGNEVTGAGTQPFLLNTNGKTPCWGCHGKGIASNIDPVTGAPQVRHTNAVDLAGGNFSYLTGDKAGVTGDTMTRGHNISDSGVTDTNFSESIYPPGDEFSQSEEGFDNKTFTCAGKFGCHGDRSIQDVYESIRGSHHSEGSSLQFGSINESMQGQTVGTSYRFLLGVKGGEDSDWHATVSVTDHNEYKGSVSGTESTVTSPGGGTISGLCAECHGNFHGASDNGEDSPWTRHPTDMSLPGEGTEYASYTVYNYDVPVARSTIPDSPGNTVDPADTTDDIIMCLSCHRVHASPYRDMLRWNYDDMVAGSSGSAAGTGCFVCHSSKDGA